MREGLTSGSATIVESRAVSLVEVLDRVLDKGLVVAGDIRVSLANVEVLTIQIRLLVCSIDKAEQIGMSWWREDGFLRGGGIDERLARIERRLDALGAGTSPEGGIFRAAPARAYQERRRAPRK
jgi:hypothetical protein